MSGPDLLPKTTYDTVAKTMPDIVAEQIESLRRLFPEVITEGEGGPRVDLASSVPRRRHHDRGARRVAAG